MASISYFSHFRKLLKTLHRALNKVETEYPLTDELGDPPPVATGKRSVQAVYPACMVKAANKAGTAFGQLLYA
jgi:hypothetical protein